MIADLNGDGTPDIAVGDLEGRVSAWDSRGHELRGFDHVQTNPAYSQDSPATQDSNNRTKRGFAGSLVAADLDGDHKPELIGAALDRHVYAWHGDGTPVAGFPVLVVDPNKVQAVDPTSHKVTFRADSGVGDGGELVATPAVADLTGDGRPEIVVGAQEEYDEPLNAPESGGIPGTSGNSREYVISPDGTNAHNPNPNPAQPDAQAYLPGWPVKVGMFQTEVLPVIGDGVSAQAAIGDLVPAHPGKEIAVASAVGPLYVFGADGKSALGQVGGKDVPMHWYGGLFANDSHGTGFLRNSNDVGRAARRVRRSEHRQPRAQRQARRRRAGVRTLATARHRDLRPPAAVGRPARGLGSGDRCDVPGVPAGDAGPRVLRHPRHRRRRRRRHPGGDRGQRRVHAQCRERAQHAPTAGRSSPVGWLVGTPALGDWDGDGRLEVAVVRRDGVLLAWHTPSPADRADQWPRFGHDLANTGSR